jgi:hypothetical protein
MFIGHFGVGFGAKKFAPGISLAVLFIAAQFLDLLWPFMLLMGWEEVAISPGITKMTPLDFTSYPITHSLLAAAGWGMLLGAIAWMVTKKIKPSVILAMLVPSHWLLDFLVHRPDLPLIPGSEFKAGLGLWNSVAVTLMLEGLIFFGGIYLYLRSTTAKNRTGSLALWALIVFFILIQLMNLFGPPPPDVSSIAWAGHLQWLFVIWAWWVDRNRTTAVRTIPV